jgi:Zn-dependent membrane protease YugP
MPYLDMTYILLVLPAVILSIWASTKVNSTFNKYSKQYIKSGMTAYDAARMILNENGLFDVKIEHVSGNLSDHYDPQSNVVRLSDSVYNSTSSAAVGVAAHECGHAIQHAEGYAPIKIRTAIVPITNIGSRLSMPLILIGILLSAMSAYYIYIAYFGVACFSLCALFQLVTLPTEYNASRRALLSLESCGRLDDDELRGAKKVLSAAAMTYVAALAVSVMQLLSLLIRVRRNDRR